jgi:hypothetical protein
MLAPASLALFAIVFLIVIVSSLGGDGDDGGGSRNGNRIERSSQRDEARTRQERLAARRFYVVRSGDTLVTISAKTGIPIERLEALNPTIDPQGLLRGQRIKLR